VTAATRLGVAEILGRLAEEFAPPPVVPGPVDVLDRLVVVTDQQLVLLAHIRDEPGTTTADATRVLGKGLSVCREELAVLESRSYIERRRGPARGNLGAPCLYAQVTPLGVAYLESAA
jgi:hypothetical protein